MYQIISFLSFVFIMLAAFTISSKYVVNPRVRLFAFSSYLVACFFLATMGIMNVDAWFIAQQIILMGINVRGLYRAIKEIRLNIWNEKANEV